MTEQNRDSRTPLERVADITDPKLFDLYHRNGLIESGEDIVYSRNEVMNIARDAYWCGAADKANDPEGVARTAAEINAGMQEAA